jgi:hypothetical protein
MELLEDADGMVRDTAKNTVIELFKSVLPSSVPCTKISYADIAP